MKQSLTIFLILLLTSCSWVKDDTEECPEGFWINLHYTYNILDVEAAPDYVKDASVYIYDMAGNFVRRMDVSSSELKANGYRVRVNGLAEGDYQFVVWSGINNRQYAVSGDHGSMDQFRLSLADNSTNSTELLPNLYYGYLSAVHYDNDHSTHDIYLMKNTNQLACLIMPTSTTTELAPSDFTLMVKAANSEMDIRNKLVSDKVKTYEPYVSETAVIDDIDYGTVHGVQYGVSTLRLMQDAECRIVLVKNATGREIFNISFPEYIAMIGFLYTNLGRPLTVQEYLDRQDFYTVVFFLSNDLEQLIQLQVNRWRLRAYNHLKL